MPLHTKYRPSTLDQVVGQDAVTRSLSGLLEKKERPHAYLFVGPSGTGKTTLARIIGKSMGIKASNVTEVDAATFSGIDEARRIKDAACVPGFTKDSRKLLIMDECHALSKNAWQSWLKVVEEPPNHLFMVFCTTEPDKVPQTLRTRCVSYVLDEVSTDLLVDILVDVCEKEELEIAENALSYIAAKSKGSPRQALVYLEQCSGCKTLDEVRVVVREAEAGGKDSAVIEIARLLTKGEGNFGLYQKLIGQIPPETSPESVRLIIVNYMASVLKNAKGKVAEGCFAVLEAFEGSYNPSERWGALYRSLGRLLRG